MPVVRGGWAGSGRCRTADAGECAVACQCFDGCVNASHDGLSFGVPLADQNVEGFIWSEGIDDVRELIAAESMPADCFEHHLQLVDSEVDAPSPSTLPRIGRPSAA